MKRGKFIVFEGCEGSGKTSALRTLRERVIVETGMPFVVTREPGGTPLGNQIRSVLMDPNTAGMTTLTELFLFCGIRAQHIRDVILPAVRKGSLVLCDRFSPSTIAYQGYGRGVLAKAVILDRMARSGFCPDAVIYLDITPEIGLARVRSRQGEETRFDAEHLAFHHRVRGGFLKMYKEDKRKKKKTWFLVDASESQEVVAEEVWKIVQQVLGK